MSDKLAFLESMLIEFPVIIIQFIALAILLWKCWNNLPVRTISILLITDQFISYGLHLSYLINIYLVDEYSYTEPGILETTLRALSYLVNCTAITIILWLAFGANKEKLINTNSVKQSVNFTLAMFSIGFFISTCVMVYLPNVRIEQLEDLKPLVYFAVTQMFISTAILMAVIHAMWTLIPNNHQPRSVAKTIIGMFVPIFSLYWFFKVFNEWILIIEDQFDESLRLKVTSYARYVIITGLMLLGVSLILVLVQVLGSYSWDNLSNITTFIQIMFLIVAICHCISWIKLSLGMKSMEKRILEAQYK